MWDNFSKLFSYWRRLRKYMAFSDIILLQQKTQSGEQMTLMNQFRNESFKKIHETNSDLSRSVNR